ncbi:MAG: DUF4268 domain-containing protein, partial [Synergistaceae bacterium]|nr:DUF4268 domain-containing protein [Synergistaceae bacterium]
YFSIGSSTCHIAISQFKKENKLSAELYTDDKERFNYLFQNKDAIETEAELQFDWRIQPDKSTSRIITFKPVDFDNKEQWQEQFDWIINTMLKMKAAFKKFI